MGYQGYRPASVTVPPTIATPGMVMHSPMPTAVPVPVAVLSRLESVVTEMERELVEIQAQETQDVYPITDNHLMQLRRILAEDLLKGQAQELEADAGRLSFLESDHLAVKRQVLELESQTSKVERERDELLRQKGALEGECENRLDEMRVLAETMEAEKARSLMVEQDFNVVKEELREVLGTCQALQEKVQALEEEIAERDRRAVMPMPMDGTKEEELVSKVVELESKLETTVNNHSGKVSELEAMLAEARRPSVIASDERSKRLVMDLEQELNDMRVEKDGHDKRHANNRTRIQELELLLGEFQAKESGHQRQHAANKQRVQDLEQLLSELQGAHDNHAKNSKDYRRQMSLLQQELEDHSTARLDKERQDKAHKAALQLLEEQLQESRESIERHMQEKSALKQKLTESDARIDDLVHSDAAHQRSHTDYKKRLADLEEQLEGLTWNHQTSSRNLHDAKVQLETDLYEREMQLEKHRSGAEQMERSLAAVTKEKDQLRHEVNSLIEEMKTIHQLKDETVRTADAAVQDIEQELFKKTRIIELYQEEKAKVAKQLEEERTVRRALESNYKKLEEEKTKLDKEYKKLMSDIGDATKLNTMLSPAVSFAVSETRSRNSLLQAPGDSVSSTRKSITARKSLAAEVLRMRDSYVKYGSDFLPGNNDPFVVKMRTAFRNVGDALTHADEAQVHGIDKQITRLLDTYTAEIDDLTSLIQEYSQKREIEAERQSVASEVSSAVHDLSACREELKLQHTLLAEDKELIRERIELDTGKCEVMLASLNRQSSLADVPHNVLQMFYDFHVTDFNDISFPDGYSPMHWAAHNGRHDIVHYLLGLDGGRALLDATDNSGRSAIYYAQLGKHRHIQVMLEEEEKVTLSAHTTGSAPMFNIPDQYLKVLEQILKNGWRAMKWKDGYTMLHWASNKGHADVCKYLVSLDADPGLKDDKGRTPIDLAIANGQQDLVATLESLKKTRRQSRRV